MAGDDRQPGLRVRGYGLMGGIEVRVRRCKLAANDSVSSPRRGR